MSTRHWIYSVVTVYVIVGILLYFFAGKTIITVFFRLLNFVVLIGLSVLLYKRFMRIPIKQQMEQKVDARVSLTTRYEDLVHEQQMLGKRLEEQDQEGRYLIAKIDQWYKEFEDQQLHYKRELEVAHEAAKRKAQRQAQWLLHHRLYRLATDGAVEQMSTQLEQRFSVAKQQRKFLDDLVHFMRKRPS